MDLNEYLNSLAADGAMSAEDRTALAGILSKNPNAADRAVKGYMMQADYTKKTQQLAADRERAASELNELNKQLSKALKDLEAGKISNATYRSRLESISEEYGIDVKDVLEAQPQQQQTQQQQTANDPNKTLEERLKRAEQNYFTGPEITALMMDAQNEYIDLFGSLKGFKASDVLKYARENNIALRGNAETGTTGAFERLYKTSDRLMEKRVEAEVNKRLEAARAEDQKKLDAALSGRSNGSQQDAWHQGSPVLKDDYRRSKGTTEETQQQQQQAPPSQRRSAAEQEMQGGGNRFAKAFIERRAKGLGLGQQEKAA